MEKVLTVKSVAIVSKSYSNKSAQAKIYSSESQKVATFEYTQILKNKNF